MKPKAKPKRILKRDRERVQVIVKITDRQHRIIFTEFDRVQKPGSIMDSERLIVRLKWKEGGQEKKSFFGLDNGLPVSKVGNYWIVPDDLATLRRQIESGYIKSNYRKVVPPIKGVLIK